MALIKYRALDSAGKSESGLIEAPSASFVRRILVSRGMYPQRVEEAGRRGDSGVLPGKVLSSGDMWLRYVFAEELAIMIKAGVQVDVALLEILANSANSRWSSVLTSVLAHLNEGSSLADALARHGGYFDGAFVAVVRAGESSGRLPDLLEKLAERLKFAATSRRRFGNMLVYPVSVMVLAVFAVGFLVTYVFPRIATVLRDSGQTLPIVTELLLGAGDFIGSHLVLIAAVLAGALLIAAAMRHRPGVKGFRDAILLRLPVVSGLVNSAQWGGFAYTLGVLLESGVPVTEALTIARGALTNEVLARRAERAEREVLSGKPLSEVLASCIKTKTGIKSLLKSGEVVGEIGGALVRAADLMAFNLESGVERFMAFLGPVAAIVLGAIVAMVALSVILPILELSKLS